MRNKIINTGEKALPFRGPANQTIFRFENVTLRVRDTFLLPNTTWHIDKGQHWAIMGPNGAGKTSLVRALTGDVPVVKGSVFPSHDQADAARAEYVSFEQHQRLIAREEQRDEFRFFSGNLNRITRVHDILDAVDVIGHHRGTNIIYVTHYADEIPASMTHVLQFEEKSSGGYALIRERRRMSNFKRIKSEI